MFPWQISRSSFKLWRSEHKLFRKKHVDIWAHIWGRSQKMCVKLSHFSFWKPPIVGISWSFTRTDPPVFWGFSPWRLTVPLHLAQSRHGLSKLLRFGAHPPDSHAGGTQWRSASWNRYVEIWMKYEDEQNLRVWWSLELAALFRVPISCCVWYSVIHR